MKRKFSKSIIMLLVCVSLIGGIFSIFQSKVEAVDGDTKIPFKYPITPTSPQWKNYTPQELKEMLNIPIEEAKKMDTKTLLKVVLDYHI